MFAGEIGRHCESLIVTLTAPLLPLAETSPGAAHTGHSVKADVAAKMAVVFLSKIASPRIDTLEAEFVLPHISKGIKASHARPAN